MLVTVGNADISSFDDADIDVLTLATGQRKTVVKGGMDARYVATGHIVYARAGSLLAVPFDLARLEVTGPPSVVASDVMTDAIIGAAAYAVSRNGSLFYAPGGVKTYEGELVWVDRAGRGEPLTDLRRAFTGAHLSPERSTRGAGDTCGKQPTLDSRHRPLDNYPRHIGLGQHERHLVAGRRTLDLPVTS